MNHNMKRSRNRTVFAVLFILFSFLTACEGMKDPFSYREAPFFAEIKGTVQEEEVEVLVYCDLTEHVTKEIYDVASVQYRRPALLKGLVVTKRSNGIYAARLGTMRAEGEFSSAIEPFLSLLDVGMEYDRIDRREDGSVEVTVSREGEQITYSFFPDDTSFVISGVRDGKKLDLNVKLTSFAKERE